MRERKGTSMSNSNVAKGREYEDQVSRIIDNLYAGLADTVTILRGKKARKAASGESGYEHQIDVLILEGDAMFAVECKRWRKKVGVGAVLTHAARCEDIRAANAGKQVSGVIATTKDVTEDGSRLAKHFGIAVEVVNSEENFTIRIGKHIMGLVSDKLRVTEEWTCSLTRSEAASARARDAAASGDERSSGSRDA